MISLHITTKQLQEIRNNKFTHLSYYDNKSTPLYLGQRIQLVGGFKYNIDKTATEDVLSVSITEIEEVVDNKLRIKVENPSPIVTRCYDTTTGTCTVKAR